MTQVFGQQIHQGTLDATLLTGPGEDLVAKLILQLSSVPGYAQLFGPYKPIQPGKNTQSQAQRWADYDRWDWSIRQLPAINVFEAETEDKDSDEAFLRGTVNIQVIWPANFRRSDFARVPAAFKSSLVNFFRSNLVRDMLDELYYIQRPAKVYGLNELGKMMSWSPNVEGIIEGEQVPISLVSVKYRIDLRSWGRALEFMDRTKAQPFEETLNDLSVIGGADSAYQGVTDDQGQDVGVSIPDEIEVTNP